MKNSLLISMSLVLVTSAVFSGCGKKVAIDDSLAVDPVEASVETGVTMVSGMADEQSGASLAVRTEISQTPSIWKLIVGPTANAAACVRAYYSTCVAGVKSVNYSSVMSTAPVALFMVMFH